jgi:hypothetical protein
MLSIKINYTNGNIVVKKKQFLENQLNSIVSNRLSTFLEKSDVELRPLLRNYFENSKRPISILISCDKVF